MPTLLRFGPYRIVIYTNDHNPAHVHILGPDRFAKVNILTLDIISSDSISSQDMKKLLEVIKRNQENLLEAWNEIRKDQE